ncbi:hypothetical protein [Sphingobacterium suaedae]|uniref:Tetratricopeptide repeat protein n=1 Tax=Sphingobacterium suaedae TaxID=1686402 RepID=A0ABW5KPQ9_9SPHI
MENQGRSLKQLYHDALVNPQGLTVDDFDILLRKYPYSQPLHFAWERRRFLQGELNSLGSRAILLASSPNWLYEYVQLPVHDIPVVDVVDDDYVPFEEFTFTSESDATTHAPVGVATEHVEAPEADADAPSDFSADIDTTDVPVTGETMQDDVPVEQDGQEDQHVLETLVREGIGGGDYFALHAREQRIDEPVIDTVDDQQVDRQEEDISLYNDELMPYSFRWWLHKTRLEYADTYQPFASPHLPVNNKSAFDPEELDKIILDQQIREHIIHLQNPEDKLSEEVKHKSAPYARNDKTAEVIERFIREEPQIQPPPAENLNTENKARKSSEEQFDLVTETLANIYADQAMYVKAIEVYKKLILRFPEKKSYFATRIKELEEKLY